MTNHEFRLRRLFNPDSGRRLDIAVDHGFFGEHSFLTGAQGDRFATATPQEALFAHRVFDAALRSAHSRSAIAL